MKEFLKNYQRLVIFGIGNILKSDDGVGSFIINELSKKDLNDDILLIDGQTVPENFTGKIRNENPTHIVIIDACIMGEKPGKIKVVNKDDFKNIGISTHSMSLSYFIRYLEKDSDFKYIFIGIEPESLELVYELVDVLDMDEYLFKLSDDVKSNALKFIDDLEDIL